MRYVLIALLCVFALAACDMEQAEDPAEKFRDLAETVRDSAEEAEPIIRLVEEKTGKTITHEQAAEIAARVARYAETGGTLADYTETPVDNMVIAGIGALATVVSVVLGKRKVKKIARAGAIATASFNESGRSGFVRAAREEGVLREVAAATAEVDTE